MFLHLGIDRVVPFSDVIGIFDIKIAKSGVTGQYINNINKDKRIKVVDLSEGNSKSFIITKNAVYFSAISSYTLKKRAKEFYPSLTVGNCVCKR